MEQIIPDPFTAIENHLAVDGIDLVKLAEKEGTPLLVTSRKRIEDNYRRILNAFSSNYDRIEIKYAVKANSNPSVISILRKMGCGADVSSPFEIMLAEKCGIAPKMMLYSPNNASHEDLLIAAEKNLTINFDDISQMKIIKDELPDRIAFRINVDVEKGEFPGTTTSGPTAKFGISVESAVDGYTFAKEHGVRKFGIHVMTGSNILEPDHFGNVAAKLLEAAEYVSSKTGLKFDFVDLGGGFGVPYRPGEKSLDIDLAARHISDKLKAVIRNGTIGTPALFIEPGRYLVADSSVMIGKVTNVKRARKTFVGTDIGMNIFLRPALYGAYHNIVVASDVHKPVGDNKDIVGQICENTDRIATDRPFPDVKAGDIIAVFNAGAYVSSMSSIYNGRGRPEEIMIQDSTYTVTKRRDTFQDVIAGYSLETI